MKLPPPLYRTILATNLGFFAQCEKPLMLLIQNRITDTVFLFPVCSHFGYINMR